MKTTQKGLLRSRQTGALEAAAGAWAGKDHPDLKREAAVWVASARKGDEKRYRKTRGRPDVPGN
jgi:hypothetical protein